MSINVNTNPIVITAQPEDIVAVMDKYTSFFVTVEGSGLTYQWQYRTAADAEWKDVVTDDYDGVDSEELVLPAGWNYNNNSYRCKITDTAGNIVYSEPAVLTVKASLAIIAQPKNVTAAKDKYTSFKVGTVGTGLSYQWQYLAPMGTAWKSVVTDDYDGVDSEEIVLPAGVYYDKYAYRCVITDSKGDTVTSEPAVLSIG